MVKWKNISKKMFMMIMSVMLIFSTQLTAFAYTDSSAETVASEEKENETEVVLEENHSEDTFSVAGNGEVLDDISDDSSKEFLTITTKNNNTFYIVIDRSSTTDNVYMLSQIDENDLKEFVDAEEEADNNAATVVLDETEIEENTAEVVVDETEEENSVTSNKGGMLAILAVAAVGVAGYYYFKFRKDNQDDDDTPDEGMEVPGTEEEKTVNEDDEAAQEAESQK